MGAQGPPPLHPTVKSNQIKSLSLPNLLIHVADEVCPILSDCLPFCRYEQYGAFIESFHFLLTFVCSQLSSETNHRISLIFCIKLALNKSKKVTKPDFQKKNYLAQMWANWAQICPNSRFLVNYSSLNH